MQITGGKEPRDFSCQVWWRPTRSTAVRKCCDASTVINQVNPSPPLLIILQVHFIKKKWMWAAVCRTTARNGHQKKSESSSTHHLKPDYHMASSAERVPEEGLPGGGDAQHLQQQAVADLRTLAALQREHVLLRGGEGDLRPQTHELPGSLVRPLSPPSLPFALLPGNACGVGGRRLISELKVVCG